MSVVAPVRGFTLVELMVVLTIIISITAIVFTSQSTFNKTLILANTAYDVALSLRSAETYGLGGHAISDLPTSYGIHLDVSTPESFVLFADSYPPPSTSSVCHIITDPTALDAQPGDCIYEANQDAPASKYTLGNSITISDFCGFAAGTWSCAHARGGTLSSLDIVFARPNPDPLITTKSTSGVYSSAFSVTSACLSLTSPLGGGRSIAIFSSGEIVTNVNTPCP